MTMPAVTASVFVGVSLDGFLARRNGDLDWLMGEGDGGELPLGLMSKRTNHNP
jgi:hypothetical protein